VKTSPLHAVARDTRFQVALLLGPVVWLALAFMNALPAALSAWMLLRFVLLQPVAEELVFRGLLQGSLKSRFAWTWRGISAANLLTSVAFAGMHLLYQAPAWALAVFVPSVIFGYFRDRHGSVAPAILLHVWYNAGFFLLPLIR
jgi:membrane protease YdiL (CAAX protease family)